MEYGQIIKRAMQVTWQYKFLWVFGIIMALCGQGSGGSPRFQTNYRVPFPSSGDLPEFPAFFPEPFGETPIMTYLIIGIVFIIIFGIIGIVVGAVGRSALIKSIDRIEDGESIDFSGSWRDGLAKAIPLGLLQALLYAPLLILGAIIAIIVLTQFWPFFSQFATYRPSPESQRPPPFFDDFLTVFPAFFATICGAVCFFIIIQITIGLFLTFGSRAIVLENQGVMSSFARSWYLFHKNIGSTIVLAVLLFLIFMGIGLVAAIPAAAIMFPIMFSTMPDIMSGDGPSTSSYLLLGGAGIIMVIIFSIINGIAQVFVEALWTIAYREFVSKTV